MSTAHTNALVSDYLRRLDRAAAALPRSRRTELVAEIREHIDDALREADASDEVTVRNVLERLGPPEEIAAAAGPARAAASGRAGVLEIAALVALAVPVVGWIVGIPLLVLSRAWSTREKVIGSFVSVVPCLLIGFLYAGIGAGETTSTEVGAATEPGGAGLGPLEVMTLGVIYLSGLASSVYLAVHLRRTREPRTLEV
jgi:uncharacterized membrane protein